MANVIVNTILVDKTESGHRVLGSLELPHVPQIGSHILAHPIDAPSDGSLSVEHAYEVVDIHYQVGEFQSTSQAHRIKGWEVWLKDKGPASKMSLNG